MTARQTQDKSKTVKQTKEYSLPPHVLSLTHQHLKKAPGKLVNILLKTSPKILTHRRKIKTLKTKIQCELTLEHSQTPSWP